MRRHIICLREIERAVRVNCDKSTPRGAFYASHAALAERFYRGITTKKGEASRLPLKWFSYLLRSNGNASNMQTGVRTDTAQPPPPEDSPDVGLTVGAPVTVMLGIPVGEIVGTPVRVGAALGVAVGVSARGTTVTIFDVPSCSPPSTTRANQYCIPAIRFETVTFDVALVIVTPVTVRKIRSFAFFERSVIEEQSPGAVHVNATLLTPAFAERSSIGTGWSGSGPHPFPDPMTQSDEYATDAIETIIATHRKNRCIRCRISLPLLDQSPFDG